MNFSSGPLARHAAALLLALALPALAAAADMELKNQAFQEVVQKGKDGKGEKKLQPVTTAVPGTEIIYVISYHNKSAKPADKVVVTNPVPAGLAYVAGSAQGANARAEVSVDGGKQFGTLDTLRAKGSSGGLRAAKGEDVTHVRWTLLAPVAPGKDGSVTYRALVK